MNDLCMYLWDFGERFFLKNKLAPKIWQWEEKTALRSKQIRGTPKSEEREYNQTTHSGDAKSNRTERVIMRQRCRRWGQNCTHGGNTWVRPSRNKKMNQALGNILGGNNIEYFRTQRYMFTIIMHFDGIVGFCFCKF